MRAFIRWLYLRTHRHEWEIYKEIPLTYHGEKAGDRYILRCKVCGEVKMKDCI